MKIIINWIVFQSSVNMMRKNTFVFVFYISKNFHGHVMYRGMDIYL